MKKGIKKFGAFFIAILSIIIAFSGCFSNERKLQVQVGHLHGRT